MGEEADADAAAWNSVDDMLESDGFAVGDELLGRASEIRRLKTRLADADAVIDAADRLASLSPTSDAPEWRDAREELNGVIACYRAESEPTE